MNWIQKHTDEYEEFWHVTPKDNIELILKNGLKQSIAGENGEGVYCVRKNEIDRTQIDNVRNFMERNGLDPEELFVVEFEYNGNYEINQTRAMFEENGWIVIPKDIPAVHIEKNFHIKEIY